MPDGSIRINTKLDTKPTEADLKKLEKDCEKTAEKIKVLGQAAQAVFTGMSKGQLNSAFKTANKELGKTEAALAAVEDRIKEIQAETDKMLPEAATDEQTANLLAMEEAETAPLLQQREELAAKAAEYKRQMEAITAEINRQTQAEAAQKALKTDGKAAAADAEWLSKIKTQEQYNSALSTTQAKMAAIERKAEQISQETGIAKDKLLQQDTEYQKLARRLDELIKKEKQFGDAGANAGKKTSKEFTKTNKVAKSLGNTIKDGIKKVGKMALAVLGIRAAYNAVRRAANAYLESVPELKQQLESLWNVAGQAIGPFIEAMIKGISTVVVWVNALIKALTGVDLVAKANAAALKKQTNATKEASKAAQLAGFDEINKLNDNSSSGDDAAGIFDSSLAGDVPFFFEKIKEQLLSGDFFGAGDTLGDTFIKWIEGTDWNRVGTKIGEFLGGAVGFALGFIANIDPFVIHGAVTSFIGGLFDGFAEQMQKWDWEKIGAAIVTATLFGIIASNPAALIIYTLLTPEGADLTKGISNFIGSLLGGLAKGIIGSAKKIAEIAKNLWTSFKNYFDKYVDWEGTPGEIIAGLWEGIKNAVKNVGKWIKDNIFTPFITGFKKAFGIASPAKEMKPLGADIINGVIEGIGNIWTKTKEKFTTWKTNLSTWFSGLKTNFKEWGSGAITKFKDGIGNIWSKVSSKFTDAKTQIGNWASSLKERGKLAGDNFTSGLKNGFDTLKNKLKEPLNAVISMVEKALNWIITQMNKLSWKIPDWVPAIGGKKFGFNFSQVSIPRLAQGGIVNNPGRGVPIIAGEAGAEAVLPLEHNTEWMDLLAEKINAGVQKIVVPIYLNGKKIAEEVIDLTKQRTFAMNGAI